MIASVYRRILAQLNAFNPTPRERAALAAIAFVFVTVALSFCYDWTISTYDRAANAQQARRVAVRDLSQVTDRHAREQIGLAAGKIWSWSITEPSESLAQARAIGELEDMARNAGMNEIAVERLAVANAVHGPNGFKTIDIRLSAAFDWRSFEALLAILQQSERSITPVAADVSNADGQSRLLLVVRLPFLPESAT